jgi:dihydroorotase
MNTTLIRNATIINEGKTFKGSVLLKGELIEDIYEIGKEPADLAPINIIEADNKILIPGVIDDQVHFRQPGLTHKGDILSESRAAVAGGITSFMEMPNTYPQTITQSLLEQKYEIGSKFSLANFSFYIGATNDNLKELLKTNPANVCGIKIFMGASTGNMLVDDTKTLEGIFKEARLLVAVHCEDEPTIKANIEHYRLKYNDNIPIECHPLIRSSEACYKSTDKAVNLASKFNTRLHVLHLSTAKEMGLFKNTIPLNEKMITSEVCIHHLWFCDKDYAKLGTKIKWNPAIKTDTDRQALWDALLDNRIDVIATDHAPHTSAEKENSYLRAPSGGPLVQHSLIAMLEFYKNGKISLEKIVEKMCHAPSELFKVNKRGFIRAGYYADLVLADLNSPINVSRENILYKCGWSPFEGFTFSSSISHTFVNGNLVYENGEVNDNYRGKRLLFNR